MSRVIRPPAYQLHKHSGQAKVRIYGRDRYLGKYGSEASYAAYERALADWRAGLHAGAVLSGPATIGDLASFWLAHCETHYAGRSELSNHRDALAPLLALYAARPAADFSAADFERVRDMMASGRWIDQAEMFRRARLGLWCGGWTRRSANRQLGRLLTMFRWLERKGKVPQGTREHMRTVPPLDATEAEETDDVYPVPEADLAATLPYLARIPRALVETSLYTGARPSELFRLTPGNICRTGSLDLAPGFTLPLGSVWAFRPMKHKTARKKKLRVILFGPKAQAALAPFLDRPADRPLFSPREAAAEWLQTHGRRINFRHDRAPGERYTKNSYYQAVEAACRRAGVPQWAPYRLRHNAATWMARDLGDELTRILLGHSSVRTTLRYVLRDLSAAVEAIARVG